MEPVMMNAQRQPRCPTIQGTLSGVTIAPTFVPALKMPVANARSFFGNHSATVLIEAGKVSDLPRPQPKSAKVKGKKEMATAWAHGARPPEGAGDGKARRGA